MNASSAAICRTTGKILREVRACKLCAADLPLGPRPVLQLHSEARILIAAQAPGSKVHKSGIPFDDLSGERLREWMGIDKPTFYDDRSIAIMPMGFCYPGRGKSGYLPPRPQCAATWRSTLIACLPNLQLTLAIGQYAQSWHLKSSAKENLTDTVAAWLDYWPTLLPLPHPSPRNNIWLKRNGWFVKEILPALQGRVQKILRR